MAGGIDFGNRVSCAGILEPASPSLQNCIQFSNSGRYFSALCDFGIVSVCELKDSNNNLKVVSVKRLAFGKGELLEGHAWSSDDEVFAVAGCKIYLFQASKEFSRLHSIPLYYMPKDISMILRDSCPINKVYSLAVAGPNGVELYQMAIGDNFRMMGEASSLHSDLAIALVQFSPDRQYLAVAALDGHFGIWTVASLDTDQKEFWYIHLKTVRITSIEFSPNSAMVAVACWEGYWHTYRKAVQDDRFTWLEFHHGNNTNRVSGDLPGSFISWSPDNRFIRINQYKENKVCLSTFDTQASVTTVTPLGGVVKGMASFRVSSGNYSLCFMRSKQCFAVPWPASQDGPVKTTAAPKQHAKLLFQECLEGSVLEQLSPKGGVTLQWRRTPQETLALLRGISNNCTGMDTLEACQPSDTQQCIPMHESVHVESECQQDSHLSRGFVCGEVGQSGLQLTDGIKTKTATWGIHEETDKYYVAPAKDNCRSVGLSASTVGKDDQILEERDITVNKGNNLKQAVTQLSENSVECQAIGSTENASQCTPQRVNMGSMPKKDGRACAGVGSFQSSQVSPGKDRQTRANEEPKSYVTEQTFRESNGVCCIKCPFLNPKLFQGSSFNSSPLLSDSCVQLLNSTNYVAVVVLPLLAYVYQHRNEQWRTLLFPCAVKCCCITKDKYLALLMKDGRIRIWCLETMETLSSSSEVVCDGDVQRWIMSGNPFEPQFSIIKVDENGTGEILRISIQPNHGVPRVSVDHLSVCYPDLLSHHCLSQLCGSIGHLIIFKQNYYKGRDQTTSIQDQEHSTLVKWAVIVPELRICQTFLEERECSVDGFVIRHHSALNELDTLAAMTRKLNIK